MIPTGSPLATTPFFPPPNTGRLNRAAFSSKPEDGGKRFVSMYLTTWCHISENNFHSHHRDNFKFYGPLLGMPNFYQQLYQFWIWCDFDRASSLICGNKMPTRCNILFLLQILLLTQHVSGTTMPIIRSSRVLYSWLLSVVFGALVFKLSVWCGAEGYVSGLWASSPQIICCI